MRSRIESVRGELDGERHAQLEQQMDLVLEQLKGIEETLHQTKSQSRQDPLNFPIRLNDKLAGVMGIARRGDREPTAGARAVAGELSAAIEEQLEELEGLLDGPVRELEDALQDAELARILPRGKAKGSPADLEN